MTAIAASNEEKVGDEGGTGDGGQWELESDHAILNSSTVLI